jgi:hypothetical protein
MQKEDVADAKEVVVETLDDGVLYGGEGAKNLVTGGRSGTLKLGPEDVPEGHRVYVQVRAWGHPRAHSVAACPSPRSRRRVVPCPFPAPTCARFWPRQSSHPFRLPFASSVLSLPPPPRTEHVLQPRADARHHPRV